MAKKAGPKNKSSKLQSTAPKAQPLQVNIFRIREHIQRNTKIIFWLSLLGIVVTAILLYNHYKPGGLGFCEISASISCDKVNSSIYAKLFGIPVALLGLLTYLYFAYTTFMLTRHYDFGQLISGVTNVHMHYTIFFLSMIGFLFQTYLAYIEFFVLAAACPLCVISHIIITIIMICSLLNVKEINIGQKSRQGAAAKNVCEFC